MKTRILTIVLFLLGCLTASAATDGKKIKVACVGNSITFGATIPDREHDSYPAQLQLLLGDDYEVGNFGRSGSTLLSKGHNPYIVSPECKAALEFAGDIVVIKLGTNDTDPRNWPNYNSAFVDDYLTLIDSFKKVNPKARIILSRIIPITANHHRFKSGTQLWRDYVQNTIATVAEIAGLELIDLEEPLLDRQYLLHDNVHPNAVGAKLLANQVYAGITGNYGGLQLPLTFTDNMVVQRYKPIHVEGRANAGTTITANMAGNTVTTTTNNRGHWQLDLPALPEGTGHKLMVSDGSKTITCNNVAVGEVWIASGQSNMAFMLKQARTGKTDIAKAADPLLRFLDMKPKYFPYANPFPEKALAEINDLDYYETCAWKESKPETAADMSAIAYYFGQMLRDSLKVPVGIIHNAIGGSGTEAWIDIETMQREMPEVLMNWRTNDYVMPWSQGRIRQNVGDNPIQRHPYEPTYLFATGIRPLGHYTIAGVIWYQGESNAHNIEVHESEFKLLVKSWRDYWKQPKLPFIFAQLSSIDRPSWPEFRDSQRRLMQEIPYSYMAVTSDWGDSLDVHPTHKQPVGERLGRWALNTVYSMNNVVPSGPLPVKAERQGNSIVLEMQYADGISTSDGKEIRTFEIAEFDGLYKPAKVEILGNNKLRITSMEVQNPRFVRYAWQPFTHANMVNGEGLPASTFKMEATTECTCPEPGIDCGVSAVFAGFTNGKVIFAGGCNFPENPMAKDAQKKFYEGIYAFEPTDNPVVRRIGTLPEPMAYGVTVSTADGLVLIGGTSAKQALNTVYLLTADGEKAEVKPLPSLPHTWDNMSACALGRKVYVAGGNAGGAACNLLYVLDLDNQAAGWKALKDFPGNPRVQPVLAASKDAKGNDCIYLFGGFRAAGAESSLNCDGLVYNVAKNKWTAAPAPLGNENEEVSVAGGSAVTLADGRICVTGGVNKDVFLGALKNQAPDYLSHPIEWYRFNPYVLVFDPVQISWKAVSKANNELDTTARAGSVMVAAPNGNVYVIGGELKPRIRTPHITVLKNL